MSEKQQGSREQGNGARPDETVRPFLLRGDDFVAAVILAFCAVVVYLRTTFDEVPEMLSQGIPPTQFPRLMVAVIAILTVVMTVQSRARGEGSRKPVPATVFITAGILLLFVAALDWLGAFAAMFLFCLGLPILWGERRYTWLAAYALLFPVGIYLLFTEVLEVRFPTGPFEFLVG